MTGIERRRLLETLRVELDGLGEALQRIEGAPPAVADVEEMRSRLAAAQESARELEAIGSRPEKRQPFFIGTCDDLASMLSGEPPRTTLTVH